MIDFTNLPLRKKAYGGANGSKLSVVYEDNLYMLKLPISSTKNPAISYTNSCTSEYLGCHIFNMLGVKAQDTILGTYKYHDQIRTVVACKDFTAPGTTILDFASVKNQIIDSNSNGYGTELNDILDTIRRQHVINPATLEEHFWNMFVVDAFIGNWDRHNGNWGFLYNQETDEISIAPIFDCGSALFPQIDDKLIKRVLSSKVEMNARVYDFPTSAIMMDKKRINYHDLITHLQYEGCNDAIVRIVPKINMKEIDVLIDGVCQLSDLQKEFLKKILRLRKEIILDWTYSELTKVPNRTTTKAIKEADKIISKKKKSKTYSNLDDLLKDLKLKK